MSQVILEIKAASNRDIKEHFSIQKTIIGNLWFEEPLCSWHIYTAFDKTNIWEKIIKGNVGFGLELPLDVAVDVNQWTIYY